MHGGIFIMKKTVLNSFKNIYLEMDNLSSYKNYYNALRLWVKKNEKYFGDKLQSNFRLRMLLDLEEEKYLVENPELSLHLEKNRLYDINFSSLDAILMAICNTLWDMVTIRSNRNCPRCQYGLGYGCGDLRYIKAKANGYNDYVILQCNICDELVNIDGSVYKGEIEGYYPARKEELPV